MDQKVIVVLLYSQFWTEQFGILGAFVCIWCQVWYHGCQ